MLPMKTTHLPEALRRTLRLVVAACLVALGGCGPGTGGTGTGPEGTFIVGPTATPADPNAPDPNAIVAILKSACGSGCGSPVLQLDAGGVSFAGGCTRFTHAGEWAMDDQRVAMIAGTVTITANGQAQAGPGTLRLAFADDDAVTATLLDGAGATVLGPLSLQRTGPAGATAPGTACGG